MSKFEKIGNITISPTLITDKETEYNLHGRKEPLTDAPEGVTSWNDLTDKPFYKIAVDGAVTLENTDYSLKFSGVEGYVGYFSMAEDNVLPELKVGQTYKLKMNDIEHFAKCKNYGVTIVLGNINLFGKAMGEGMDEMDTGETYCYLYMTDSGDGKRSLLFIATEGEEGEYTVSITEREEIEQLDTKYLPDHLQFGGEVSAEIPVVENVSGSWAKGERPGVDLDGSYTFNTGETYKVVYEASISGDTVSGTHEGVADEYGCIAVPCSTYTLSITAGSAEIPDYSFAGSLTLSIYKFGSVVETLDAKYLPKGTAISDVTEAPTAEQFNALLASLREAGVLAE